MRTLKIVFFVSCGLLVFTDALAASPANDPCQLPQDLRGKVAAKYPGAKLVTLADLDADDRKLVQTDHGDHACPGLASVDFYDDGKPTFALVLVDGAGPKEVADLVVAHRVANRWRITLLDAAKSSIPVVWIQPPGKYDDVYGNKSIQATRPVIVFCGYDSWSVVYAWKGDHVDKVWLSD